MGTVLAVDIGGTKIEVGLVDEDGSLRRRDRVATEAADGEALFARLASLIDRVRGGVPVDACGVGCGGPMTPGGAEISPLNIPQWRDFPLLDRLHEVVGEPTFIDNDAKALALGEGWLGAAAGHDDYLAMVVSTGVGGGIVVDGRLIDGHLSNAGHIGHVRVGDLDARCVCGGRGCLEAQASGPSIERMTGRPARAADDATKRRVGSLVGEAVASVVVLLDLRLVLIAGSVALGFGEPFFDAAQEAVDEHCRIPYSQGVRVRPAGLGADGPLIGAAAVARRRRAEPATVSAGRAGSEAS